MDNKPQSEKQSLDIIQDMINTAKQEQTGAAFYLTLWGFAVFIYSVCLYIGIQYRIEALSYAWIVFPLGGLVSMLRTRIDNQLQKVSSMSDRVYAFVWAGVGFILAILMTFSYKLGIDNVIPLTLLTYTLASFTTGGATRYSPSIVGAVLCAVCAIFAFQTGFKYQLLLNAVAIVCVHIVPGLMMKSYYKRKLNAQ